MLHSAYSVAGEHCMLRCITGRHLLMNWDFPPDIVPWFWHWQKYIFIKLKWLRWHQNHFEFGVNGFSVSADFQYTCQHTFFHRFHRQSIGHSRQSMHEFQNFTCSSHIHVVTVCETTTHLGSINWPWVVSMDGLGMSVSKHEDLRNCPPFTKWLCPWFQQKCLEQDAKCHRDACYETFSKLCCLKMQQNEQTHCTYSMTQIFSSLILQYCAPKIHEKLRSWLQVDIKCNEWLHGKAKFSELCVPSYCGQSTRTKCSEPCVNVPCCTQTTKETERHEKLKQLTRGLNETSASCQHSETGT